jgi:hypothetical protein
MDVETVRSLVSVLSRAGQLKDATERIMHFSTRKYGDWKKNANLVAAVKLLDSM